MKTKIFFNSPDSVTLNENFAKQFGSKVNLEAYSREQLEDIRNKLRTKIFQQEGSINFNDLLTNEAYQKDKAMLQLINTRIKEMLGEDIKQLRNKMVELSEAKKGVRAPKYTKKAKGSNDGNLANNAPPYDQVTRGDVIAGRLGKDQMGGKAAKEGFGDIGREKDRTSQGGGGFKAGSRYGGGKSTFDLDKDEPTSDEPIRISSPSRDDDLPKITSTDPGKYGDPFSTRTAADVKVRKGSGTVISPEERMERRMASQYLELLSDGEPVTPDEIQDVVDTMRASDSYRERVMKRVKMSSDVMEAEKKCNHTAEGKMCPVHGMKECSMEEATERKAKVKPSKGMTAKEKSAAVKQARSGKDMGKTGKGFEKIERAAGGGEKGKKIAGAAFWKGQAKKAKANESKEAFRQNVRIVNENLVRLINENEEEKAKAITAASDIVNDYTSWMQRVGQYQTKALIELGDAIRADFGPEQAETFKATVAPALSSTLETLMQQREAISNAVAALAGEEVAPTGQIGPEPGIEKAPTDMMNAPAGDEFAASEPAAGGGEAAGREVRESRFTKKLAESHSIISKLAR